ncbi:hypothetical protein B0H12DRAFT_1114680 [Mycena haematopus]|nr:hypothetical protein B0H12DRAFT_1114680 [Mycena haematopus]
MYPMAKTRHLALVPTVSKFCNLKIPPPFIFQPTTYCRRAKHLPHEQELDYDLEGYSRNLDSRELSLSFPFVSCVSDGSFANFVQLLAKDEISIPNPSQQWCRMRCPPFRAVLLAELAIFSGCRKPNAQERRRASKFAQGTFFKTSANQPPNYSNLLK